MSLIAEIDKTAHMAWSPADQLPICIAAGTAGEQLDLTSSSSPTLDIFVLHMDKRGFEVETVSTVNSDIRFHKLIWTNFGSDAGMIVGGSEKGLLKAFNPSLMLNGDSKNDDVVEVFWENTNHTGVVSGLDANPFQGNLIASGASESEIFIWDLNNVQTPMTPGSKAQPPEDVTSVSWNRQVQHILGSTFPSRCVVWDLRRNEPIIKISDSSSRMYLKTLAWHPEVATQLCIASEDNHSPYIQMWDLRFATSPVKCFERHEKGVTAMSWCPQDSELLLSCGKDSRILCWNPNSDNPNEEILCEFQGGSQWNFDIAWCPRDPNLISTASLDGYISVYNILSGVSEFPPSPKVVESFGGNETFDAQPRQRACASLSKPPKWMKRPCGARFSFGGKLVTFGYVTPPREKQHSPQHGASSQGSNHQLGHHQPTASCGADNGSVYVFQIVTNQELVKRAGLLDHALSADEVATFCQSKAAEAPSPADKMLWDFLRVTYEQMPRSKYLSLLGFNEEEVNERVRELVGDSLLSLPSQQTSELAIDPAQLSERISQLNVLPLKNGLTPVTGPNLPDSPALLSGTKTPCNSRGDGNECMDDHGEKNSVSIPSDMRCTDGLIGQAVITGNIQAAVELCLKNSRFAEALLLAMAGGPELFSATQDAYLAINQSSIFKFIHTAVNHRWMHLIGACNLDDWKEALAAVVTYGEAGEFQSLVERLGKRLEDAGQCDHAMLCYVCAGNLSRMVSCWIQTLKGSSLSPLALQDAVDRILILRRAIERSNLATGEDINSGAVSELLSRYVMTLANEGQLSTAYDYLAGAQNMELRVLQERIFHALSLPNSVAPQCPFRKVEVGPQISQYDRRDSRGNSTKAMSKGILNRQRYSSTGSNYDYSFNSASSAAQTQSAPYAPVGSFYASGVQPQPPPPLQPGLGVISPLGMGGPSPSGLPAAPPPLASQSNTSVNSQPVPPPSLLTPQPHQQLQDQQPQHTPLQSLAGMPPPVQTVSAGAAGFANSARSPAPAAHYEPLPVVPSQQIQQINVPWNDPPPLKNFVSKKKQTGRGSLGSAGDQTNASQSESSKADTLPTNHQQIQDFFESLSESCKKATPSQPLQRKLADVSQKMEILYIKLRDESLSDGVLKGLYDMVKAAKGRNYVSCLQIHQRIIAEGDFSEISGFMPCLKMLLQCAQQLRV